jgi:hypothetical protein
LRVRSAAAGLVAAADDVCRPVGTRRAARHGAAVLRRGRRAVHDEVEEEVEAVKKRRCAWIAAAPAMVEGWGVAVRAPRD